MAFPLIPAIAAAATVISSGIAARSARKQQKKANKFNVEMWNRQNAYNDPREQMMRLKGAGLNPNLIYGSGSTGASGTAGSAPQFTAMSETGYKPIDVGTTLSNMQAFTDWDIKKAQEDKLATETELNKARIIDTTASAVGKTLANVSEKEKARIAPRMADLQLDAAKANIQKTMADTQFRLNEDERKAIENHRSVIESVERVYTMRTGRRLSEAQISNLKNDNVVKQLQAQLAQSGITPETPWYAKAIERLLERLTDGEGFLPNLKPKWKLPWQ